MSFTLYLVRHAESEMNKASKHIGGQSNWVELSENGKLQAKALGHYFSIINLKFDTIYSSPAIRTQQTARYCFDAIGETFKRVNLAPELMEQDQGDWEGQLRDEIYNRKDVRTGLDKNNWDFRPGDKIKGERQLDVALRMKKWVLQKANEHKGESILAFSHGTAIKLLLAELFNRHRPTAYKTSINNTSVTIIQFEEGKFHIKNENKTEHLKIAGISKLEGIYCEK